MMKKVIILFVCIAQNGVSIAQSPVADATWQLAWGDEFDGVAVDETKWIVSNYMGGRTLYLSDYVDVTGGNLVIEFTNDAILCPLMTDPSWVWSAAGGCTHGETYTTASGWIESREEYDQKYGYLEASIKFPYDGVYGATFFPAFWTFFGESIGLDRVNAAEIDIVEILGEYGGETITSNGHRCYDDPTCHFGLELYNSGDYYSSFHKYAVLWTPEKITWFLDDNIFREEIGHEIQDPSRVLFNFAVSETYTLPNAPSLSFKMFVDYFRYYKLNLDCDVDVVDCSFPFPGYNLVKKSVTIGWAGCSNIQPTSTSAFIKAKDFIEINGDFEVPLGSEIELSVDNCY